MRLRDGVMGAHVAYPDTTPAGAIIAIMEIWGVNDTMRRHAQEFAEAGFVCLVPDLFWRQEPGVELSDHDPEHVKKAFDLYYDFDYDLGVRDMEDTAAYLERLPECNGKVGAVGYCLGGKTLMRRHDRHEQLRSRGLLDDGHSLASAETILGLRPVPVRALEQFWYDGVVREGQSAMWGARPVADGDADEAAAEELVEIGEPEARALGRRLERRARLRRLDGRRHRRDRRRRHHLGGHR